MPALRRPTCNDGKGLWAHTAQGTVHSATRAFGAITDLLREHPDARGVHRLVLVGHSFGGVYGRMVASLLADAGILVREEHDESARSATEVEPETAAETETETETETPTPPPPILQKLTAEQFITFASPHLGIRRPRNGPWWYWRRGFNNLFHLLAPVIGGFTGTELLQEDEDKILVKMSTEEKYLRALRLFKKRVCYGNVFLDMQVPLCTSTMRTRNPYRAGGFRYDGEYPTIMELCEGAGVAESEAEEKDEAAAETQSTAFSGDAKGGSTTRLMQLRLDALGWQRVDCYLSPDAHNMILGNNWAFQQGRDVLRHLVLEVIQ